MDFINRLATEFKLRPQQVQNGFYKQTGGGV